MQGEAIIFMMKADIRIFELEKAEVSYVDEINRLLLQLSSSPVEFGISELEAIVASPSTHLFILECEECVAGMLTLGEYLAPTGRKMWIEDVVVDNAMRGRSLGRALVEHAIEYAGILGCGTLMLTSRPSRIAANALYRSCGFASKETNVYRMPIHSKNF